MQRQLTTVVVCTALIFAMGCEEGGGQQSQPTAGANDQPIVTEAIDITPNEGEEIADSAESASSVAADSEAADATEASSIPSTTENEEAPPAPRDPWAGVDPLTSNDCPKVNIGPTFYSNGETADGEYEFRTPVHLVLSIESVQVATLSFTLALGPSAYSAYWLSLEHLYRTARTLGYSGDLQVTVRLGPNGRAGHYARFSKRNSSHYLDIKPGETVAIAEDVYDFVEAGINTSSQRCPTAAFLQDPRRTWQRPIKSIVRIGTTWGVVLDLIESTSLQPYADLFTESHHIRFYAGPHFAGNSVHLATAANDAYPQGASLVYRGKSLALVTPDAAPIHTIVLGAEGVYQNVYIHPRDHATFFEVGPNYFAQHEVSPQLTRLTIE